MPEKRAEPAPGSGWPSEARQVEAFLRTRSENVRDTQDDYLFLGRAPDAIELIGPDLHSFEAKLKNWRKAVEQARDHQLVADYAWIVIPRPRPEWVAGTRIGLIDGDTFEVVVEASRVKPLAPAHRKRILARYWPAPVAGEKEPGCGESKPLFPDEREYERFREAYAEAVRPQLDKWKLARRKSEEEAGRGLD